MSDHDKAGFCLREGLCADIEGDWHIHVISRDRKNPDVFFVGGWPYTADGYAIHEAAPRILDVWELGSPKKYISPERRQMIARAVAA
jgi:hypothetical protein